MNTTELNERQTEIINDLIAELAESADPDYLEETLSEIFTEKEKEQYNIQDYLN